MNADDRDLWWQMAAACKSGLGEVGLDIWMAWSETSDRFNRRDALSVWRSFKAEGGITIGSLFSLAREGGWYEEAGRTAPAARGI